MDIYNELDLAGITLTVILVGQEELLHQRSVFLQAKKAQIVGRFMIHAHQFTGIRREDDLFQCLVGYDENSEYPNESGWSFTRYFFPDAFEEGFRLQNCTEELFNTFVQLRQESGIHTPIEIPMQYVTLTVDYVLRKFGTNGKDDRWLHKSHWRQAIERSGYLEAELYQSLL